MTDLSNEVIDHLKGVLRDPDLSGTRYRLIEKIAEGGMGEVYAVEDKSLGRRVALKILKATLTGERSRERMVREARIIAQLEHPSIIPIYDAGVLADGRVYYAMKLVRGSSLRDWTPKQSRIQDKLRVILKVCEAVAFAHDRGVIHRDLKPDNIMMGEYGEVLVMDWGVAKFLKARENTPLDKPEPKARRDTGHGSILGTAGFMAPEQAEGRVDLHGESSDVYALGAVLRFLIEEAMPDSSAIWKSHKPLAAIVAKAVAQNPSDRYLGAKDLAADLSNYMSDMPVSAYRENPFEKMLRWIKRNQFIVILLSVYILVRVVLYFLK